MVIAEPEIITRFVRIGIGRDASDASFATIIGVATLTSMAVWAQPTVPNQIPNQPVSQAAAPANT